MYAVCNHGDASWLILEHEDGGELRVPPSSVQYMHRKDTITEIGVLFAPTLAPIVFHVKESPSDIEVRLKLIFDKLKKEQEITMHALQEATGRRPHLPI